MNQPSSYTGQAVDRDSLLVSASSSASFGLKINDIVRDLGKSSQSFSAATPWNEPSLAERVFAALSSAKIWTSKVAMHMDRGTRDRYFRQLDLLHDCDEWFDDQQPLILDSYRGFVRFMLSIGSSSKPSLALSPMGRLLAVWQSGSDRLTIEFLNADQAEWVVSRRIEGVPEHGAGCTSLKRLPEVLAPYEPEAWF